jgi:hypothetical protein
MISRTFRSHGSRKPTMVSARGRRFSAKEHAHALSLIAAGMKRDEVATSVGCSTESLRRWYNEAKRYLPTWRLASAHDAELSFGNETRRDWRRRVVASWIASKQPMKQPSQARAATKKQVILFLAAKPSDTGRLALDREARTARAWSPRAMTRPRGCGTRSNNRPRSPSAARSSSPNRACSCAARRRWHLRTDLTRGTATASSARRSRRSVAR